MVRTQGIGEEIMTETNSNNEEGRPREQFVVYLSGTMDEDKVEHREWRRKATKLLGEHGIITRSPYRGRDKSKIVKMDNYHYIVTDAPVNNRLSNMLVARDLKDVQDCDMLLVNLRETKGGRPSIGTISELAWAYEHHKPVVCVVDKETSDSHYYKHPFVHQFISQWVSNVEDGVSVIVNYWHPQANEGA